MKNTLLLMVLGIVLASAIGYSAYGEKDSPFDHIPEDSIKVYQDKVIIDIQGAQWAKFTDTNSMDPVFDSEANTIELKPKTVDDVKVGDIVSYKSGLQNAIIVHRVISIDYDSEGWYATLKGDNNVFEDPERVRFGQVNGVVVAVIY